MKSAHRQSQETGSNLVESVADGTRKDGDEYPGGSAILAHVFSLTLALAQQPIPRLGTTSLEMSFEESVGGGACGEFSPRPQGAAQGPAGGLAGLPLTCFRAGRQWRKNE